MSPLSTAATATTRSFQELGSDNLTGGTGSNTLAYVSVSQGGLSIVNRSTGVLVQLPEPGTTRTGGAIGGQEKDVIHSDIRTLIGTNRADGLTGSNGDDTILGAAPVGTGNGVVDTPAGNDTIFGRGGNDNLVGGDKGLIDGGDGNDTIVGGRSAAASDHTVIHGAAGDDTLVSGPGNDEMFGDAGANTLAYVSVTQAGINIVSRSTGVLVLLPETGTTGYGGAIGGPEKDIIHDDIRTLIGSNSGDFLIGSNLADTIVGAAPVGTGSGVDRHPGGQRHDLWPPGRRHLGGRRSGADKRRRRRRQHRRRPKQRSIRPHGDPRRRGQRHDRFRAGQR